jgi:hypothetical protein
MKGIKIQPIALWIRVIIGRGIDLDKVTEGFV